MKIVGTRDFAQLAAAAAQAPRLRSNLNLHDDLSDPVQRVVIAVQPGTYVRPHRHADHVWEVFLVLQGRVAALEFDAEGVLRHRVELRADGDRVIQMTAGGWHSVVALEADTVVMEVKPGPYVAETDKTFAAWAPPEGAPDADAMVRWLEGAQVGDRR